MTSDPQFTAGAGARYSCWRLSELREWFDLGFIGVSEAQDVENYCGFIGAYDVLSWFRDVIPLVHGPVGCVASFSATRVQTRAEGQPRPLPYCTALTTQDAIQGGARKLREAILDLDAREHPRLIVVLATCPPSALLLDSCRVIHHFFRKTKRRLDDVSLKTQALELGAKITVNRHFFFSKFIDNRPRLLEEDHWPGWRSTKPFVPDEVGF